ncbi:hypothetical protein POM88_028321 [Heracleum sosnowskyi]|uniref:HAT C-terminal dimerisation domain-containing protein n=1 Tax=Heracleum sosnowskyi TaxID=360622 RepID=A0AAD8I987_9APIA|nr:hypothetical protein POM88_028321 [Heracleum sosnowskyi]
MGKGIKGQKIIFTSHPGSKKWKKNFSPIDVPSPSPTLNTTPTPTSDPLDTNPNPNPSPEPIELKSPKKEKDNDDLLNTKKKPTMKDEQAFNVVEGVGFKDFINELQPRFVVPSRMTVTRDIYTLFCNGRLKLRKELTADGQKDGTCDSASKTINKEKRQRRLLENYMQQQQLETTEKKNDIDIYLAEEPLNPMIVQFDILVWWKDNASRYKTLSMIVKDILVIPVSTVASESTFSTSGRILDPFRSSLSPKMLEALVCTQSWLKGRRDGIKSDTYLDETYSYEFLEHEEGNPGIMKECAEPSGKTINIDD